MFEKFIRNFSKGGQRPREFLPGDEFRVPTSSRMIEVEGAVKGIQGLSGGDLIAAPHSSLVLVV